MKHGCFTPENENLFVGARHASPLQKGVFHGKACGYIFHHPNFGVHGTPYYFSWLLTAGC
jgi:hypothetical protein